jgi:hypothetical protein
MRPTRRGCGIGHAANRAARDAEAISDAPNIPGYPGVWDGSFRCYEPGTHNMQRLNGRLKNALP